MLHAARNGCSRTIVRGNYTDICIILLAYLPTLLQCNSSYKLLFDCGTGASRFMFNINHIGDCIGLERCRGLLFVYSLSGCDFTPSFFCVGKLKFFALYISNTLTEEDLKVFKDLSSGPTTTRSALYYHALRSAYVSGHLWGQADLFAPELPAFVDWGL